MNYTYPDNVYITYTSKDPNLHVRAFLHERLEDANTKAVNPATDNAWKSNQVYADVSHGKATSDGYPILLARQERLDSEFRGTKVYFYSAVIPEAEPGTYVAEIVAWNADTLTQGNGTVREAGTECDREYREFQVNYSMADRVLCYADGKEETIASALTRLVQSSKSNSDVVVGNSGTDWEITLPNIADGECIRATYKKGDEEGFIGKYFDATVTNCKVVLQGAPEGTYIIEFKSTGDKVEINNPNC